MSRLERALAVFAALACGLSVAIAAYASHAAQGQARERLALAAALAFGHGLAVLATQSRRGAWARLVRIAFAVGIVLFSGSLVGAALFAAPTMLAPVGGSVLMLGWGILAIDFLRAS